MLWPEGPHTSDCGRGLLFCPRKGIGVRKGTEDDCNTLLVALDIAALRTRAKGGLIPHARHGANGVCSVAVCGSKFDGTGFEKEQIGHIQVAVLAGGGSGFDRWNGLSVRDKGDALALLEGVERLDIARFCTEDRFEGLGMRVIFAEDFRKPACSHISHL